VGRLWVVRRENLPGVASGDEISYKLISCELIRINTLREVHIESTTYNLLLAYFGEPISPNRQQISGRSLAPLEKTRSFGMTHM
jgi:hypothetical protein